MKVTIENWHEVEHDLQSNGVADAEYDEADTMIAIISKSGVRYEVSKELFLELQRLGVVTLALGTRVDPQVRARRLNL